MDTPDLSPRPAHPVVRCVLLLVPITWAGIAYGLWQRRRSLWLSKPRSWVEQCWQQVSSHRTFVPSLVVTGSLCLVSVTVYGVLVYGVPLLADLFQPSVPNPWSVDIGESVVVPSLSNSLLRYALHVGAPFFSVVLLLAGLASLRWGDFTRAAALIAFGVAFGYLGTLASML